MIALIIIGLIVSAQAEMQEGEEAKAEEEGVGLERIVVTNRRAQVGLGESTEDISVVSEEEIKKLPSRNLGEVLNYISGVNIDARQGFGRATAISIQGSTSRQVRVMIDGIPLNSQANGQANPSILPVEDIARIEVIKGASSSLWGSGLGGVINVITKDTGKTSIPKGSLSTSFAGFKTQKESLDLSGKAARLGYYLFSSYMESGGKGPRDDVLEKKGFGKLSYDLKDMGKIIASFGYSNGGMNSGEFPDGSWQGESYRSSYGKLSWEGGLAETELKVELKNYRQELITRYYGSVADDNPSLRIESRDRLYQLSLNSATRVRGEDLLVLGADFDCDTLKSTYLQKAKAVKLQAPYVNYTLKLEPWDFNFGLRYDRNTEFGEQASPAVGFVYKFKNAPDTLLRATVSRAFNAPALLWKYNEDPSTAPNPDLRPERAWVYEAGLESRPIQRLWLKLSLYRSDVTDALARAQYNATQDYMENFEKFRKQGAELQFRVNIFEGLDFYAAGAFNDVENRATRETVRGGVGPRQNFNLGIDYKNKTGFSLSLRGYYNRWNEEAAVYLNQAGDEVIVDANDRKMLCDVRMSQGFKNLTFFLNIHNLTNSKYWQDYNFPFPERYFEGGVTFNW